jgi:hypothetical protein
MKNKLYKKICTWGAICFLGTGFAQKIDKKFTENFKVNKDVEVFINASNSEIYVTNWEKDEVQVDAFIEIEGLSQEEADKYLENWNFEALGNKNKVQVISGGSNSTGLKNDFVFFNNTDFSFPEIEMPDFNFNAIKAIEESMEKDRNYPFEWSEGETDIVIHSKKEWESFMKTEDYQKVKMNFKKNQLEARRSLLIKRRNEKKLELMKRKAQLEKVRIVKRMQIIQQRKDLINAKKTLKNIKFSSNSNDLTILGKKVKIKKRIEIKVPKGATFNLKTKHCKVKLPNTVASGTIKYGSFDANNLIGGTLTVDYAPTIINSLNDCTLFLNNVTVAKIASVTNTRLFHNYSDVKIHQVNENVSITNKFGKLIVESLITNYKKFNLNLNSSEASLNLTKIKRKLNFEATTMFLPNEVLNETKSTVFVGFITANDINRTINIEAKHSELTIIK